ncbi:hypothetical protein G3I40_11975 [Streptomyces sp. SID14478]|uniref:hypothetical protein n=1 Tax=Streptomyces sp. SID14478 TaxID=2706073 RepID=UPI0013D91261|nr:hypothetical protein [Streptomyces sp. SID14478]NEB75933.1 hypothetical protein [Streptomyces sp. SID14478]
MLSQETTLPHDPATEGTPFDVTDLICVTPPYLALQHLRRRTAGDVSATVPVETPRGRQAAVMGIGEVGRHLAILGLCAAASVNPREGRHAYLARTAEAEWVAPPSLTDPTGLLTGNARAQMTGPRQAHADTELVDSGNGQVLARMRIGYDVLPHRLLTRLLEHENPGAGPVLPAPDAGSAYSQPLPLENFSYDQQTGAARADLLITPALCPGHFDGHPVLPVAIAATAMSNLVDHAIAQRHPHAHWLSGPLTLTADQFACAGQTVTFQARPAGTMGYHCTARLDSRLIASVNVKLILVDSLLLPPSTTPSTPLPQSR